MIDHKQLLFTKIAEKSSLVGVIGLGYVSLPLARVFEEAGFPAPGFDVDPAKPKALLGGDSQMAPLSERV